MIDHSHRHAGFTLIELMIVVAIIAVIASIALPTYQDYVIRTRVSEALVMADAYKATIVENVVSYGGTADMRACENVTTLVAGTKNVASMSCEGNGVMTITTTQISGPVTITLTPSISPGGGVIMWRCARTSGKNIHVPSECRS